MAMTAMLRSSTCQSWLVVYHPRPLRTPSWIKDEDFLITKRTGQVRGCWSYHKCRVSS